MTRPQRALLITGFFLIALTMHALYCDWSFGDAGRDPLIGWSVETTEPGSGGPPIPGTGAARNVRVVGPLRPLESWGIVVARGLGPDARRSAILFGLVIPLVLILAGTYFALGWRRAARAECGRCLRCGYDLHYDYPRGCPECGWRRTEPSRGKDL